MKKTFNLVGGGTVELEVPDYLEIKSCYHEGFMVPYGEGVKCSNCGFFLLDLTDLARSMGR